MFYNGVLLHRLCCIIMFIMFDNLQVLDVKGGMRHQVKSLKPLVEHLGGLKHQKLIESVPRLLAWPQPLVEVKRDHVGMKRLKLVEPLQVHKLQVGLLHRWEVLPLVIWTLWWEPLLPHREVQLQWICKHQLLDTWSQWLPNRCKRIDGKRKLMIETDLWQMMSLSL